MTAQSFIIIQKNLGYQFYNILLLEEALRHSSYVNEQSDKKLLDNERLEFLGDAVLNLAIGHIIMNLYPDIDEGTLSKMRASLVNEASLAEISRYLNIGAFILLGKGEAQSNGYNKQSILAGALEAILAAIYLDSGFDVSFQIIKRLFKKHIDMLDDTSIKLDYKGRLQELVQLRQGEIPRYSVIHEAGPDHDKTFTVELKTGTIKTSGLGKTKKDAEQDSARKALEIMQTNGD